MAFLLWIGWLMMMSYTIVTRTEPRWIESTAYNLVNGLIGLGLLLTATTLGDRAKRTVVCKGESVYLDAGGRVQRYDRVGLPDGRALTRVFVQTR